jgi:hypothetical protein
MVVVVTWLAWAQHNTRESTMTNTVALSGVGTVEELAATLTKRLLEPRKKRLHNRAPRSKSVHQLRRDLKGGRAKAVMMILRVIFADIEERVPADDFLPFVDELREAIIVRGAPCAYTPTKTLRQLLLAEARAQGERDQLEIELRYAPDDEDVKRRFADATVRYNAANAALAAAVSRDAALLQQRFPRVAAPDYTGAPRVRAAMLS